MKFNKTLVICFSLLLVSITSYPQDRRTVDTKVADLLARMPANDLGVTDRLMGDMILLGDEALQKICDQVIPAGSGDDTGARVAIESLSRFLSRKGKEEERIVWEKICIRNVTGKKDIGVQDFFIKQLQVVGSDLSVATLQSYLSDKDLCEPATAAIAAIGGQSAESALAGSLKNNTLPCGAAVMNALASMKSDIAVNDYLIWAGNPDLKIKSAALNALAQSGSPLAFSILSNEAKKVLYAWEPSGATSAFLNYALAAGQKGYIKTADKICKLVISKAIDDAVIQNKIAALRIYTSFHGAEAMPLILKASADKNKEYRVAAMKMSLDIPGEQVSEQWLKVFRKADPEVKAEIISILGERKDEGSKELIASSLTSSDADVRTESAAALAKISGESAIPALIDYLKNNPGQADQQAAVSTLKSVMKSEKVALLIPVLKEGSPAVKKSVIELMAWAKRNDFFSEVFPFTASADEQVKTAAFSALPSLAGTVDIDALIKLLASTEKPELIAYIQNAIINATSMLPEGEDRSEAILNAISDGSKKEKLIPVLAKTGGSKALETVLNEFESGTPEMREIVFKALSGWKDHSASSALFEICTSGNKSYEAPAFAGFVRQVRSSNLPDDQKLLLYRKIMPYAFSAERKNELIAEAGRLKTYPALFFVSNYLDDNQTSTAAASAAMSIALPSEDSKTGLTGNMVKDILTRAMPKISGAEADYDKENVKRYLASMPADEGFVSMFNGVDLTGWKGLVENPVARAKMKPLELAKKQAEADKKVSENWSVKDGCIWFSGKGNNLCSIRDYGDFEMFVDWKISKEGDSGIYLRGTPQVQIWDPSRINVGAQVGSGGLYNNKVNPSKPLVFADNPVEDWNTFRILMIGEKVSVWLNGHLVVDDVVLENYWDRSLPIFPAGAIELQAHGNELAFRDIYVREIRDGEYNLTSEEKEQGFVSLFNGRNLDRWIGNKESYVAEDGLIVVKPAKGSGGNLYTEKEYSDFIFRFEFQLTPAANNGLGIRAPLTGDAAYVGMELQILDNDAPVYAKLQPYQYHGSVYGVIPSKRGFLKPTGEWNYQEVEVRGTYIKITLNGTVITEGDIAGPRDNGTMDHKEHPGLKNTTGHIAFLGHGSELKFRNIRIKDLSK